MAILSKKTTSPTSRIGMLTWLNVAVVDKNLSHKRLGCMITTMAAKFVPSDLDIQAVSARSRLQKAKKVGILRCRHLVRLLCGRAQSVYENNLYAYIHNLDVLRCCWLQSALRTLKSSIGMT